MKHRRPHNGSEKILGFKERLKTRRKTVDIIADFMTNYFGTVSFFTANAILFASWTVLNLGLVPGIKIFDPYPFNFLTMVVSLEAIFLSVIVLISQNRSSKIADLREETNFAINARAEEEITKILKILDEVHDHIGLNPIDDQELTEMKKNLDIEELERRLEKE